MDSVTIRDIAKICGVSVSTVSRAMNNHPDINKETKDMILKVIEDNNYIPNNSARNLKRIEANTIAVLIKGINNPFFYKMMEIFQEEIGNKGYSFVIQQVDDKVDEVDVALELIKEKRLKGIVFLGGYFSHTEEKFKQISVPFVLTTIIANPDINPEVYSHVSVDDVKESEKMIRYLCRKKHKKIAMLASRKADISISSLRIRGYKMALEKEGLAFDENLIMYSDPEADSYSMENGYHLAKNLLASKQQFTAVFALSDRMAVGACRAFIEAGLKIPEDVSVCGFDGLDMAYYYNPSITTIRQPVEEMARETIKILFQLIMKKGSHRHCVFEGTLIEGESTRELD